MNINKSLLTVALGLGLAGQAMAFDEIYLTGSTAARSAVYATMTNPGSIFISAPVFTGFGGSGSGDSYMAFYGTLVGNSSPSVINCSWSGSEAGIVDVATTGGKNETFIDDSLIQTVTSSDPAGSPGTTQSHPVDICMADNSQSFSPAGKVLPSVTGAEVGVVPFKWMRNPGVWTGSNVTDAQIQAALGAKCKLAVFTGNAGDTNTYVYVAGRDNSSGTRVNAYGDCGYGIATVPNQIELSSGAMVALATNVAHVGPILVTNVVYDGNYGQSSGGTLGSSMNASTTGSTDMVNTNASTGFSAICYIGVADSAHATGATLLTYDGVAYTTNNIIEGTYTFWGNEYAYKSNGYSGTYTPSSNVGNVYTSMINTSTGVTGVGGDNNILFSLNVMHSTRTGPTSYPTHN